jgi:hypothetical protein
MRVEQRPVAENSSNRVNVLMIKIEGRVRLKTNILVMPAALASTHSSAVAVSFGPSVTALVH